MVMREKTVETALINAVKVAGGFTIKLLALHFAGIPDRLCLLPGGRAIFVEVKAPGKVPTPRQLWVHQRLKKLGFNVLVIDNTEDAKNVK